ncbi:MAG: prepilin peptidase [Candidatus Omnitrophica bacterium]|nr:prepilin peptidase [Candidatus Omnitrophota bacterium]
MIESNILIFMFFMLGIIIGSFLNVCIFRWPLEQSVVTPRSKCFSCQTPIAWYDNIPLLSYVLLAGKCRNCKAKFSIQYFLIELLTGLTFVGFYLYYGLDSVLIPYLFMVSCFIIATFVDFGHRIIPDQVSVGGLFVGLIFSFIFPNLHQVDDQTIFYGRWMMRVLFGLLIAASLLDHFFSRNKETVEDPEAKNFEFWTMTIVITAIIYDLFIEFIFPSFKKNILTSHFLSLDAGVIGFMLGGGFIYGMGVLGDFLFKKEAMGGGDVKLLAMIGAFLGWKATLLAFFIAPFFGALFGLIEKIRTKDTTIAYGPFLVLGALMALFCKDQIIHYILVFNGLR